jgi:predicted histidine transporter YuiF (NhaC family)
MFLYMSIIFTVHHVHGSFIESCSNPIITILQWLKQRPKAVRSLATSPSTRVVTQTKVIQKSKLLTIMLYYVVSVIIYLDMFKAYDKCFTQTIPLIISVFLSLCSQPWHTHVHWVEFKSSCSQIFPLVPTAENLLCFHQWLE